MIFADFILQHQADDPAGLALARDRYADFADFPLALSTLEARRKLSGKVPDWVEVPSLHFPLPLSAEQCSSSETADYKSKLLQVGNIADLTGGLGVDAWAFAKSGCKVLYNDMKAELVEAARHNFAELGVEGVQFSCAEVAPGAVKGILGSFKADAFFLDPARRDNRGGKVFRIAECSPDVTALLPELFSYARFVLIKLSPMLDISLGASELGQQVREVHVVGADGECKELLFLLDRDHTGLYSITVADGGSTLQFSPAEEQSAQAMLAPAELPSHLFVPGKALLKAGCFKLLSQRYGLLKAGTSAHLYFADAPVAALQPFGRWYRVLESATLDKRSIRDFAARYPDADVTARAVPLTSDELRKRLGSRSGGPAHIFAFHHEKSGRNLMVAAAL